MTLKQLEKRKEKLLKTPIKPLTITRLLELEADLELINCQIEKAKEVQDE